MLKYIWMISWSWLSQSVLARGHKPFCALCWVVLDYIMIFSSLGFILLCTFLFKTILGYRVHVSAIVIWYILCTEIGSFSGTGATCYSPSDYVPFGKDQLLYQWTCAALPVMFCHSLRVICWMFTILHLISSFFSHFSFSMVSGLETCLSCS